MLRSMFALLLVLFVFGSDFIHCLPSELKLEDRIVNGEETTIEKFNYMANIEAKPGDKKEMIHNCGGSIISETYILTAAHCLGMKREDMRVRVGSTDVETGGAVHEIARAFEHPEWDSDNYYADVGLLELKEKIELSPSAQPVRLPEEDAPVETGTMCEAAGWGKLKENGEVPKKLHAVYMPVIDLKKCKDRYTDMGYDYYLSDIIICAGDLDNHKDTCQGDSGGPLVANGTQLGVVSWGVGCARKGNPGVYTQVSAPKVRSWIKKVSGV